MTVTKVDIYNLVCGHLGVDPDVEATDEKTKKARVISAEYDTARKFVLKAHDWGFAKDYFTLTTVGTPPAHWAQQYKKPNKMLKPRFIMQTNRRATKIPFTNAFYQDDDNGEIAVILTDQADAVMVGTRDIEEPDLFSVEYYEALGAYIAFKCAHQFTDSKSIKQNAFQFYNQMLAQGAQIDATSEAEDEEQDADWIRARGGAIEPYPEVLKG